MLKKLISKNIIPILVLLSFTVFVSWFLHDPVKDFKANIPGQDNRPDSVSGVREKVKIGENFELFSNETSELTDSWTRFRGADFDNIKKGSIPLLNSFGKDGPKIKWSVELGEGHAAPVIYNGKVYLLDYVEDEKADVLRCFLLETGKELWQRGYNVHVKRNHGMSRTVPAITEKYIVTIGPRGQVMCTNPENGDYLWGIDMIKEYGTEIPFWYTGQCPLIDNDTAIFAPGGKLLMMGVDCATGKIAWETPNPEKWQMSHSSIIPMAFGGKKMYVYAAIGGICGISAEGNDKGQILWKTKDFAPSVVAPSPLILDNGKILVTAGYGAGSILIQLTKTNNTFTAKTLNKYKPKKGIASEQQTPILFNNHIFTILPKDAGSNRNRFVCTSADDCTKILWTSGKTDRFGLGPYVIADGKFFILKDDGTLTIAKASTSKFTVLDKKRIIEGQDAWGPIAIADGYLLMRDSKKMVCIDVRKR